MERLVGGPNEEVAWSVQAWTLGLPRPLALAITGCVTCGKSLLLLWPQLPNL